MRRFPEGLIERVAPDHPAIRKDRLVAEQARSQDIVGAPTARVQRSGEGDLALGQRAGLVGEEDLDVAEILDATSRLTTTERAASRLAPVERLTVTIAGRSCGVRPTAIARAKRTESSTSARSGC